MWSLIDSGYWRNVDVYKKGLKMFLNQVDAWEGA